MLSSQHGPAPSLWLQVWPWAAAGQEQLLWGWAGCLPQQTWRRRQNLPARSDSSQPCAAGSVCAKAEPSQGACGHRTATGHQDKGPARAEVGTALCCSVSQYGLLVPPNPNWFFCLLPPTVPARRAAGPKCKPVRKMTKCLQKPGKDVAHLTKSFSGDCS